MKTLLNVILNTLDYKTAEQSLLVDNGYSLDLDKLNTSLNTKVLNIISRYNSNEINLNGVILALSATKARTKIKGISTTFQSDKECSMLSIRLTVDKKEQREVLEQIILNMESWGYLCGEGFDFNDYSYTPQITLFTDNEHTIKMLKDDYREALKLALQLH
jgi:hypothetical protein